MFERINGGLLAIGPVACQLFDEFRQTDSNATEAGGFLLGRLIPFVDDVVIDSASRPSEQDFRARFEHRREVYPSQDAVTVAWQQSGGISNYLGEWHTHPEDLPVPSKTDFLNWANIMTNTIVEYDFLFFVIVGIKQTVVWEGSRQLQFVQLPQRTST